MKTTMTSTAVAVIFALTPFAAQAAAQWSYSDVDSDGNLELTEREFEPVSRGAFAAWDANQDQRLTGDELYTGIFSAWDTDNDNMLNEAEYREGFTGWFGNDVQPQFNELAGDDFMLTQDEFSASLRDSDQMAGFDTGADGLDVATFHVALFETYDADDDQNIAQDEYAEFGDMELTNVAADDQAAAVGDGAVQADQVIAPADWDMEPLYANGMSVDYMIDEMEVYGATGDEIGSIENIVFAQDGRVLSLIAEVGGFWDMFDQHVNVPWEEVSYTTGRFTIPVTEETLDDYSLVEADYLSVAETTELQEVNDDLATGPRAFRATELMGDYARIRDNNDNFANFGYVNDLIIADERLQTVVVDPETGYGMNDAYGYGYPYYGNNARWNAGSPYYDMPYGTEQVVQANEVEFDRFGYN